MKAAATLPQEIVPSHSNARYGSNCITYPLRSPWNWFRSPRPRSAHLFGLLISSGISDNRSQPSVYTNRVSVGQRFVEEIEAQLLQT